MTLTFLHGSLVTLGTLLMAIPVILHLTMRRRPRHAEFPALRFVTATLVRNRRKLQLRQWALLALRCLAVGVAAIALAFPLLPAGAAGGNWLLGGSLSIWIVLIAVAVWIWVRGPSRWLAVVFSVVVGFATLGLLLIFASVLLGGNWLPRDQEEPIAAVFIVDDAARMEYRENNATRLSFAQDVALRLLKQLPPGSDVAILPTSAEGSVPFTNDVSAVSASLRGLATSWIARPIPDLITTADSLLQQQSRPRQEIYIFTDLTRAAWPGGSTGLLSSATTSNPERDLHTYIVDVGVKDPKTVRLGVPQSASMTSANNHPWPVEIAMMQQGYHTSRDLELELWLEDVATERPILVDGKPQLPTDRLRDRQRLTLTDDASQLVRFSLRGVEPGVRHGRIRVKSSDGLSADDERYFTIARLPADRVLIAVGNGANPQFVAEALSPFELRQSQRAKFDCEVIAVDDLPDYSLSTFAAVILLDPAPLPDAIWQSLARYVEGGGGLALVLGRNAEPLSTFNSSAAMSLLPGKLQRQWKAGEQPLFLALVNADHPILMPFAPLVDAIPWDQSPIFRHWVLTDISPSAIPILRYRNRQPALIESRRQKGTILTWTTSLSDELNVPGRPAWNMLPTGSAPWPFVMLVHQMTMYLTGHERQRWNYSVGEIATLSAPGIADGSRIDIFTPNGIWESTMSQSSTISVGRLQEVGSYRVALTRGGVPSTGLSANLAPEATDLTRLEPGALDSLLGPGRYRLLSAQDDVVRDIHAARVGQEAYPWLIVALALILSAEHLLGNRFYDST